MVQGIQSTSAEESLFNIQNQGIDNLKNLKDVKGKDGLMKAAQEFEAVFITKMMDVMDSTVERSDFLGGGKNEQMFKSMMNQEVARSIASNPNNSFGMAKQIYEQMEKLV